MEQIAFLWQCALQSLPTNKTLSCILMRRIFTLLRQTSRTSDTLQPLLCKACAFCGAIFLPSRNCSVRIVSRRQLAIQKQSQHFVHARDVFGGEPGAKAQKSRRCKNFVVYECGECDRRIVFDGASVSAEAATLSLAAAEAAKMAETVSAAATSSKTKDAVAAKRQRLGALLNAAAASKGPSLSLGDILKPKR